MSLKNYFLKQDAKKNFKLFPTEELIKAVEQIKSKEIKMENPDLVLKVIKQILKKRGVNTDFIEL